MPAIQSLRPSRGEGNELLRDPVGGVRAREREHRPRHVRKPPRIVDERTDQLRRSSGLVLRHDDRAASLLEVAGVLRLMIARREEPRNENGRLSPCGTARDRCGIGLPVTWYFGPSRPSIGNERKTRRTKGVARRFARPSCASASITAVGIRRRAAAYTIGPATYPPPPSTTSGRLMARIPLHVRRARPASRSARTSASDGRRAKPATRNVSSS